FLRVLRREGNRDRHQTVGRGVVPELAAAVETPALDAAAGQRTRVAEARGDGLSAGGKAGDLHGYRAAGRGVVPELAVAVVAPALDAAIHQRTRVVAASSDGLSAGGEA